MIEMKAIICNNIIKAYGSLTYGVESSRNRPNLWMYYRYICDSYFEYTEFTYLLYFNQIRVFEDKLFLEYLIGLFVNIFICFDVVATYLNNFLLA